MSIREGEPYRFGKISFVGNTVYSSNELTQKLGIKENDIFDQSILESRLFGSVEGTDSALYILMTVIYSLMLHQLKFQQLTKKLILKLEYIEGKQARINNVMVKGNTKTNDHVIMRELRTRPGDLFKRSDIMRSQRELAQMQYFNPEKFDVKIDPDPVRNEVDITYIVEEKSSDQIQLQGGWGAGRIVGSLGFKF